MAGPEKPLAFHALILLLAGLMATTSVRGQNGESSDGQVRNFESWLEKRGVIFGSEGTPVEIAASQATQNDETGKSRAQLRLVATRDIALGEVISSFPSSLMVHSDSLSLPYHAEFRPEPGSREEREAKENWGDYTTLAAWILREKAQGSNSEWAPYIAVLPQHVPISISFEESTLQVFEDEKLVDGTNGWRLAIEAEYVKCDPEIIAAASEEEFKWAMSVVISRAYSSAKAGPNNESNTEDERFEGPAVLIPLADLANHADVANWKRFSIRKGLATADKDGGFEFRATREVHKGDEIVASYGMHSNRELIMTYGYMPEHNLDEPVVIAESVEDAMVWAEEHIVRKALLGKAERQAMTLVNAAQRAVEDIWKIQRAKHMDIHSKSTETDNSFSQEDALRAENFYLRAMYKLAPPDDEGRILAVWPGGLIDPRVVAAVASLSFFSRELQSGQDLLRAEVDLPALANASINYGWAWIRGPCESLLSPLGVRYVRAMVSAGGILQAQLKHLLKEYPTKVATDVKCLKTVQDMEVLPGGEHDFSEIDSKEERRAKDCLPELLVRRGVPKYELELALRYKIHRKQLLQTALDRLDLSCGRMADEL